MYCADRIQIQVTTVTSNLHMARAVLCHIGENKFDWRFYIIVGDFYRFEMLGYINGGKMAIQELSM